MSVQRAMGGLAPTDGVLGLGSERFTPAVAPAVSAFAVNLPFDQIPPLVTRWWIFRLLHKDCW